MKRKKIAVIDGQGGGIGSVVIKELKKQFGETFEVIALGTNSIATASMLAAGANKGATGENAIIYMSGKVDYLVGSVNILISNSMLGELTEKMAFAISSSEAKKIILPITQENLCVVGATKTPLPHLVSEVIKKIKEMEEDKNV